MPLTEYIGGDTLVFDWVKANEFKVSDLDEFSGKAGVKGDRKYHIWFRDKAFKFVVDDEDLRSWAHNIEDEDPDLVIGNELINEDENERGKQLVVNNERGKQLVVNDERGKQPIVEESDSGGEGEPDLLDGDDEVDFDETRISDEDNDEPKYPIFNPKTTFNPEFSINQIFATKHEFKKAAQSYAINVKRNICFSKNDGRRVYANCVDETCKWKIHALKMKDEMAFQVRKYEEKHTCAPTQDLSERFLQRFQSQANRDVAVFMVDAIYDTRCQVSRQQAYKARAKALLKIEGDPDLQYSKLWSYVDELRKACCVEGCL
ncbi:hypothetical protein ACS0TY_030887 [Phlomoides rotata]